MAHDKTIVIHLGSLPFPCRVRLNGLDLAYVPAGSILTKACNEYLLNGTNFLEIFSDKVNQRIQGQTLKCYVEIHKYRGFDKWVDPKRIYSFCNPVSQADSGGVNPLLQGSFQLAVGLPRWQFLTAMEDAEPIDTIRWKGFVNRLIEALINQQDAVIREILGIKVAEIAVAYGVEPSMVWRGESALISSGGRFLLNQDGLGEALSQIQINPAGVVSLSNASGVPLIKYTDQARGGEVTWPCHIGQVGSRLYLLR